MFFGAQKLEDLLWISSVLKLIPYFGFFNGVGTLKDERTNQLHLQVKENFQVQ